MQLPPSFVGNFVGNFVGFARVSRRVSDKVSDKARDKVPDKGLEKCLISTRIRARWDHEQLLLRHHPHLPGRDGATARAVSWVGRDSRRALISPRGVRPSERDVLGSPQALCGREGAAWAWKSGSSVARERVGSMESRPTDREDRCEHRTTSQAGEFHGKRTPAVARELVP